MDGAQDRHDRARLRAAQWPAIGEELLHFAVEADAYENRVALGDERFRTRGPLSAELFHRVRLGRIEVTGLSRKTPASEVPDDRRAHAAGADDADRFQFARNGGFFHRRPLNAFA